MKEVEIIPFAPDLIESIRAIGYSFETAIADIVDNSISALATKIDIIKYPNEEKILIIDNGIGMSSDALKECLRFGSKNPLTKREEYDLGRFGLGLKTASLSLCRKLTVLTKEKNILSCCSWDLDHIINSKNWNLIEYDDNYINNMEYKGFLNGLDSGTIIILENFDRLSITTNNLEDTLTDQLSKLYDHIALIYHRFLEDNVKITINSKNIEPLDPFLENHNSTEKQRQRRIDISDENNEIIDYISVTPYILPHLSKLSKEDKTKVGGIEKFRSEQGFYIYRNKRLIIHGTWFKITRKEELSKLCRIKVDIPNSLDYMWNIDVKKSTASLPPLIKNKLLESVFEGNDKSEKVISHRIRKNDNNDIVYIWNIIDDREKKIYEINRDIPIIKMLEDRLNDEELKYLDLFIKMVEKNIPTSNIYTDEAKNISINSLDFDEVYNDYKLNFYYYYNIIGKSFEEAESELLKTEPYFKYCDEIKKQMRGEHNE